MKARYIGPNINVASEWFYFGNIYEVKTVIIFTEGAMKSYYLVEINQTQVIFDYTYFEELS